MRISGLVAAAAALGLTLANLPADAASDRQHRGASARGASPSDNMADDLNARSLQRAQSGMDGMSGSGSTMGAGSGMGMPGSSGTGMPSSSMGGSSLGGSSMGRGSGMGAPGMSGGGGTGSSGPVGAGGGMR